MDTKPTHLTIQFDPDRTRAWSTEQRDEVGKWIDGLGLDHLMMPVDAPIIINTAEHTIATRYVAVAEGTKAKKGETPETIPDGQGGVITQPFVTDYKSKNLPEVPSAFHTALTPDTRTALGI